jgi:hypothetical protein
MPNTNDVVRVIAAVEAFLPILVRLVRDLKGLLANSGSKTADQILSDADSSWQEVITVARKEIGG